MRRSVISRFAVVALASFCLGGAAHGLDEASATRTGDGQMVVNWRDDNPVDVYVSPRPDAPLAAARRVARADREGVLKLRWTDPRRPYFILRDDRDGAVARVAERLLPLDRGSNFRDLGGYPGADGKHVRWGMIYRTAAMPMLTDADYRYVSGLGIRSIIDLRSVEERQIAPDGMPAKTGARYLAHDYPADTIFSRLAASAAGGPGRSPTVSFYRTWLISLAPQYRDIFAQLLKGAGAVSYHCSAGQDRTGVATALVLSALGVPREVIMADYHLSTADRRPENEMPPLKPGEYPGNIVAAYYLKVRASGAPLTPRPLYSAAGTPFLQETFDEIDARWGSVDAYLDAVLGVDKAGIARLRALYLE